MVFKKIDDCVDSPCWISGIYKIVLYEFSGNGLEKKKHYAAYYKPKGWKNWGNHVDPKTPEYRTLKDAKAACEKHEKENENV